MRSDEAARIIEKEKRCVLTDCERPECKNCGLVMDTGEILEALDMANSALKKQELGLILNACLESGYISDINFFYFWIIGIFLFALIYEVNY